MAKQTESTEKKEKERTLEEAFLRLDEIIQKLEKKDTTLEDSFLGYQEGIELIKFCNQQIDTVEKKILVLNEEGKTPGKDHRDSGILSSERRRISENGS